MASLLDCAALSWAAYTGVTGVNEKLPDFCKDLLLTYECRDVADGVLLARRGRDIVLAFRGTSSWSDLETDLQIWRKKPCRKVIGVDGALVHDGFADAYRKVAQDCIAAVIDTTRETHCTLTTTGHSKGGAIATLCAVHAATALKMDNVRCVTFGSPGVGNVLFVSAFKGAVKDSIRAKTSQRS